MPLVHPSKPQFRKYLTEKISGTYNLAFAYKKPMLCPEDMAVYEDFKDTSVFYNLNNFADFINTFFRRCCATECRPMRFFYRYSLASFR